MDHVKHEFDLSKLKRREVSKHVKPPPFMFPGWKCDMKQSAFYQKRLKPEDIIDWPNYTKLWLLREEHWARMSITFDINDQVWCIDNDLFWPNSWQESRKIKLEDLPPSYTCSDVIKAFEYKIFMILNDIAIGRPMNICLSLLGDKASLEPTPLCNYINSVLRQPDNADRW